MAQLYKMTLYVCDLCDDLSLNEIKTRIDQYALEWDDDIDLNEYNDPASVWEKYFE